MNYICKKHNPPFRWVIPEEYSPEAKEASKVCACGEDGELDIDPSKPQLQEKTGIQLACSLLERWYGTPTTDPTLSAETYDFLVGSGG